MKYTNGSHISADDRLTLLFSYGFGAAMTNIFGALLNGASLFPYDLRKETMAQLAARVDREASPCTTRCRRCSATSPTP